MLLGIRGQELVSESVEVGIVDGMEDSVGAGRRAGGRGRGTGDVRRGAGGADVRGGGADVGGGGADVGQRRTGDVRREASEGRGWLGTKRDDGNQSGTAVEAIGADGRQWEAAKVDTV